MKFTHSRSSWLGSQFWKPSTPTFEWTDVDLFVVHWPGSDHIPDGDPGEYIDSFDDFLRNVQRQYINRGYNIGYNVPIDWLGGTWEARGTDYECAANAGINNRAFAVFMCTDLDGRYTSEMVNGVRDIYQQACHESGRQLTIIGHNEGIEYNLSATKTACPGPLQKLVDSGAFKLNINPTPTPPVPSTPVGTYTVMSGDGWFLIGRKLNVEVGLLLQANNATLSTALHPGMVLQVPGVVEDPTAVGASYTTPDGNPTMQYGYYNSDTKWLQYVLCSMPKLNVDGGGPIFNPEWIGKDSALSATGARVWDEQIYGDATRDAVNYWKKHNSLTPNGEFDTVTAQKMAVVRGK